MPRRAWRAALLGVLLAPALVLSQERNPPPPTEPPPGFTNLRDFLLLAHARYFGDAELMLVNNGPSPVSVRLRWLVHRRGFVEGATLVAAPHDPQFLSVRALLPDGVGLASIEGLEVAYHGRAVMHVSAQAILIPSAGTQPIQSLDVPPTIPVDVRGPRLEAVWATPRRDEQIVLAVANLTGAAQTVTATRGADTLRLPMEPWSAQLLTLAARADHVIDSLRLEAERPGLRASGYSMSSADRIPRLIRFYDPRAATRAEIWANAVRIRDNPLMALVKNTLATSIRAKAEVFDPADGRPLLDLPAIDVPAGEARAIDMDPLLRFPIDVEAATLRVTSSGPAGSVVGALQSIDAATGLQRDAPLRDSGHDNTSYRRLTGNCLWRIDGDYNTTVTITNVGDQEAGYVFNLRTGGIVYAAGYGSRRLAVGASATFDFRKMRDEGSVARSRQRQPLSAAADRGQCQWSAVGPSAAPMRLMGRAEIVSPSRRVSSTHSW